MPGSRRRGVSVCTEAGCPALVASPGPCSDHGRRDTTRRATRHERGYDSDYVEARNEVLALATTCYLCGEGPKPDDPLTADHVDPTVRSGPGLRQNLRPAHRSCNTRKGRRDFV